MPLLGVLSMPVFTGKYRWQIPPVNATGQPWAEDGALAIYCDVCSGLFCIKCMGIPKSKFEVIENCKNIKMVCNKCLKFSFTNLFQDQLTKRQLDEQITNLGRKIDKILVSDVSKEIKMLETKIDDVKNVGRKLETEMNKSLTYSMALKDNLKDIQTEQQHSDQLSSGKDLEEVGTIISQRINQDMINKQRKEEVERSIIINGLKEEDTKKFDERMKVEVEKVELLITDGMNITLPKIEKVYRLGKYSIEKKSPRPMRVVFKEKIEDRVLRNAPNLKTADDVYRTCYVNKDMNSDEKKEFEEKMKEAKDLNLQEGNEKKFFVVRGYPTKWKIVEKVRSTK